MSASRSRHAQEVARARAARRGAVRRRPRRLDRQRRAAVDRPRPRLLPGRPVLGRQRLHAHLRRLPAARRPHGRPARPPAHVHRRPRSSSPSPRSPAVSPRATGWLIAARAVQGLGAALLSPAALSLVTTIFAEGAERNKALGVWGAVAGSGGAAGVLLGGMLTEYAGWEWVLFVNVPIGLAAAFFAPRLLPESRNDGPAPLRRRRRRHGDRRPVAARLRARRRQQRRLGLDPDDRR